jgi:hypothetical protein
MHRQTSQVLLEVHEASNKSAAVHSLVRLPEVSEMIRLNFVKVSAFS